QRPCARVVPVLFSHLFAVGPEPGDVGHALAANRPAVEITPAPKNRVLLAKAEDPPRPRQQVTLHRPDVPMQPRDLVVLAVGVVIAFLGPPEFVAVQQHRHALRHHEGEQEVALLARTQLEDLRIIGFAFDAAIPAVVALHAVSVAFAVRFVVALVVRNEVPEREPVVGGDVIDARVGLAAVVLIEVAASREPVAQLADLPFVALPKPPHIVAILTVPFSPEHREVADLVATLADIPRFGDELDL